VHQRWTRSVSIERAPARGFQRVENHCAFYPMSSMTVGMFRAELKDFETSTGTIRFTTDEPLPPALVKKLVKARMAENAEQEAQRSVSKRAKRNQRKTS